MKIVKILSTLIPPWHYKWAGIKEEEKDDKKNDLDVERLDKLVKRVYDEKYKTYDSKGKIVDYYVET